MTNITKILWLADYTTKEHQGGAQQTNKLMLKYAPYNVKIVQCKDFHVEMIDRNTLIIINNITQLSDDKLRHIIKRGQYIRYCHDYACIEQLKNTDFYKNCLLNIFLSPLHSKEYQKQIGYEIGNIFIQNSPVDTKEFKYIQGKREDCLWVGDVQPHKGIDNIIEFARMNQKVHIDVIGFGNISLINRLKEHKNIHFIGEVKHKDIAKIYNRYDSFIHLPKWKEPFGRTILEAYLCGCDLIVNNNLGCKSFDWDWTDYDLIKQKCEDAPDRFWNKIKQIIGGLQNG